MQIRTYRSNFALRPEKYGNTDIRDAAHLRQTEHDAGFKRFQVERLCCKIITCTEIGMAVC